MTSLNLATFTKHIPAFTKDDTFLIAKNCAHITSLLSLTIGLSLPSIVAIGFVSLSPVALNKVIKPNYKNLINNFFDISSALYFFSLSTPIFTALAFYQLSKPLKRALELYFQTALPQFQQIGPNNRSKKTISIGSCKNNITISNACIFSWSRATPQQKNYTKAFSLKLVSELLFYIPLFGFNIPIISALGINLLLNLFDPTFNISPSQGTFLALAKQYPLKPIIAILALSSDPIMRPLGVIGLSYLVMHIIENSRLNPR